MNSVLTTVTRITLSVKITGDGTLDEAIKDRNPRGRKAIAIMNCMLWGQIFLKEINDAFTAPLSRV